MNRILEALGWALVHSLWQLTLVGLFSAFLMRITGSLRARYLVLMAALGLCLAIPVLTFAWGLIGATAPSVSTTPSPAFQVGSISLHRAQATAGPSFAEALRLALAARVALLAGLWALGASIMAARLSGGLYLAGRWRRTSEAAPEAWERLFRKLAVRIGASGRAAIRVSTQIATPLAMGFLRPAVLIPASILSAMPEPYLEALLAHELAHLARWDYFANLLQSAVEMLCFHHPVVWWLSSRARDTRELLADELAASALGEPRLLALALDALDDLQPHLPSFALSARGGSLQTRIHRLISPTASKDAPWMAAPMMVLLLACASLALKAQLPSGPPVAGHPEAVATLDHLAHEEGVDPQLLRSLAWVESGLVFSRRGPLGATGLLQVTPETAKRFGAQDLADREQVDRAGARYVKFLLGEYKGDVGMAVTAYTCGEEATGEARKAAQEYTSLVLELLKAKAVQPASALAPGAVEGTLRRLEGDHWVLDLHLSTSGDLDLEVIPADPARKAAPFAKILAGTINEPGTKVDETAATWTESWPRVSMNIPAGTQKVKIRYLISPKGWVGETEVTLDAPWKSFAFHTAPAPAAN